jgi:O-antigen ligase
VRVWWGVLGRFGKRRLSILFRASMPEHIRALVVILLLATPVWWIARSAFSNLLPTSNFSRWRNLWFLVTLALFLSHNYWLFAFLLLAMVMAVKRQETHIVGLYFVLLFAGSPVPIQVPGFGLINYVLILDHYRLLNLTMLLPVATVLMQSRRSIAWGKGPVDYFVLAYFLLVSVLEFRESSFTNGARGVVTQVIDVLLPYYVISRSIRDIEGFKAALAGFVIAACLLAPVAVFESVRGWRLYTSVQAPLGLNPFAWSEYLGRAGLLRAAVSLGHPIVLGFVFMVAMGFLMFLNRSIEKRWHRWLAWGALAIGLFASLSRGPWVGALLLGLTIAITAAKPMQNLFKSGFFIVLVVSVLGASSVGQQIIGLLPFLGTEDSGTIDYRVELWSFVWPVVERNFWFGSEKFITAPELQALASIQGQGIADLVNHYFEIVLASGAVGLALFFGTFARALQVVWRGLRQKTSSEEQRALGTVLFSTQFAILVTISTVSGVTALPVVLWSVLGLCAAYSTMARESSKESIIASDRSRHRLAASN